MPKYFIDCNGVIYPVTDKGAEWFVVNHDLSTVYTIDSEDCVTGEYTLWNSLLELALALNE
jgi:hypothetical protein